MGITRLAGRRLLAVPMMAATIGLATPTVAEAATVAPGPRVTAEQTTGARLVEQPAVSPTALPELGSWASDRRGLGRSL